VEKQKQTVAALIVLLATILVIMIMVAIMIFAEDIKKGRPTPASRLIIGQVDKQEGGSYENSSFNR